jgi:hypothetical protein
VAAELEGCLLRKDSSRLMFRVEKFEPESETTGQPNDYTSQEYALHTKTPTAHLKQVCLNSQPEHSSPL